MLTSKHLHNTVVGNTCASISHLPAFLCRGMKCFLCDKLKSERRENIQGRAHAGIVWLAMEGTGRNRVWQPLYKPLKHPPLYPPPTHTRQHMNRGSTGAYFFHSEHSIMLWTISVSMLFLKAFLTRVYKMSCTLYVVSERVAIYSNLAVRNRNTVKLHIDYMYCNYLHVFLLLRALQSFRQWLFELSFQLV